jgi:multidrug transporter EmrE-like cation transporter
VLTATLLALGAAVLHAGWNLLVKTSGDRELAAWAQFAAGAVLFVPVLVAAGGVSSETFPFLAASGIVHLAYVEALVRAYHHGDFSFAYPVARGGGAMGAALLGALFLDDTLPAPAWIALAVVAGGLISFVRPGVSPVSLWWAAGTAVTIGVYSVIDTAGARHAGSAPLDRLAYAVAVTVASAVTLSCAGLSRGRGGELVALARSAPLRVLGSGVLLTGAYALVLLAVSIDGVEVGYVATLRESSVVLGALIGWLFLHESLGKHRLVSSCVVLVGMAGLVLARA